MTGTAVRFGLLTALLFGVAIVSLGVGAVHISPGRIAEIFLADFTGPANGDTPASDPSSPEATILRQLRLPRVLLACVVGCGLAAAGAGYQGLFRNPLADPFVIGASSGSALGATLAIVSGWQAGVLGFYAVPAAALVGALTAVAVVYAIASIGGRVAILSLLLAGVAVSSLVGALVSLLMFLNDEQLSTIFAWLMGSLAGRGWTVLGAVTPLVALGTAGLWLRSRSLDALTFGEETAASLGLSLVRLRGDIIVAASLATAAAVAAGGIIGFVGLIAPHIARSLFGARHAVLIPAGGMIGAILLLIADSVARTIAAPTELPVGVMTALLGAPFFLFLLKTRQRELGAVG